MSDFDQWLRGQLSEIDSAGLRRRLRVVDGPQGRVARVGGRELINFSSNDYLGLAADARVREAALAAVDEYGLGAGASRLISGTQRPHAVLEQRLATFKRSEAAVVYSTGYAAALGTIKALAGKGDVLILDKLCHACLVDAARMSGATLRIFPHNDLGRLARHLEWARARVGAAGRIGVLTESVFSMDGDVAPLREIAELKERWGAWLLVDEAHAVGVLGERGRGLAEAVGVADRIEVQMGTLGKALGAAGGYVVGSRSLIEFLVNRARSFVFSTAPSPVVAAAAGEAVRLLDAGELEPERERLWRNVKAFDAGATSAIVPVMIGDEKAAVDLSDQLRDSGVWVPAVRYPTVARGAARLRVTLSAAHTLADIAALRSTLASKMNAEGVRGRIAQSQLGPRRPETGTV